LTWKISFPGVESPSVESIELFRETRLVRITHGGFAIWLDPFGMLDPQVVVNLLPEFGVSVDLVRHGHRLGATNEFHKRLSFEVDCSKSARNEEPSSRGAFNSCLASVTRAPVESGDRAKRCFSEGSVRFLARPKLR
jgi:hypothetical protein